MTDEIKLVGFEKQAFSAWVGTYSDFDILSFSRVAYRAGMQKDKVRRAVRGLARKGLAHFCNASWTDDGEFSGAGYGLTEKGRALLESMKENAP